MSKSITIRIPAAPYADHEDCLAAAARAVAAERGLDGWDLSPRWADDQRDEILLDVPADRVTVGNWTGPVAVARNLMDDEIAESLHMRVATEQEFVDRYCAAHAAKYGADFEVS